MRRCSWGACRRTWRRRVADVCFREDKTLMLAPTMMDIMLAGAERIVMEDTLLYVLNTDRVDPAYRAVKRGLDVLVSALGLLILSPLLGVLALCVHLYDGGPVFYRQVRLTEGGREFRLIKFRSMIVDAESRTGAVLAGQDRRAHHSRGPLPPGRPAGRAAPALEHPPGGHDPGGAPAGAAGVL